MKPGGIIWYAPHMFYVATVRKYRIDTVILYGECVLNGFPFDLLAWSVNLR